MRYLSLLFLIPGLALADVDPGKWQLSVTSAFEGMPGVVGPIVQEHCLTAAEARDPSRLLGSAATPGCTFANQNDDGSRVSFDVKCGGALPMEGSGAVRYTNGTVDGELSISGDANGQKFATRMKVTGRRIGAC